VRIQHLIWTSFPERPCSPWTRFRLVAAFGDKIRRFDGNVSEMKRLAGHDFEDLLQVRDSSGIKNGVLIPVPQCIIPCIEGLFPEPHNTSVIELLFIFATWHALAKLHVHTDTSLRLLDTATTALGNALRYFVEVTCPEFDTFETSAEYTKRQRQQAAAASSTLSAASPSTGRQRRTFSLRTIKLHFLGDYVSCIKMFGTTDNYNTALVCWFSTAALIIHSS